MKRLLIVPVLAIAVALMFACGDDDDDDDDGTLTPTPEAAACDPSAVTPGYTYDELRPSVVMIYAWNPSDPSVGGTGTGFVVSRGEVMTNEHVVAGATEIVVEFEGGRTVDVDPDDVRVNRDRDIALINVDTGDAPSAVFGDSQSLQRGERLVAIGYPSLQFGDQEREPGTAGDPSISDGIFSSLTRVADHDWLLVTMPINAGNSGGPVSDFCGLVYGVATASYLDAQNQNLAVPSNEARIFRQLVLDGGGDPIDPAAPPDDGIPASIAAALRGANISLADLPPGFEQVSEDFTNKPALPGSAFERCGTPVGIISVYENADAIVELELLESGVFVFSDDRTASDCFTDLSDLFTSPEFLDAYIGNLTSAGTTVAVDDTRVIEGAFSLEQDTSQIVEGRYLLSDGSEIPFQNITVGFRIGSQAGYLDYHFIPTADYDLANELAFKLSERIESALAP
ncbi:MAG TPA: serine protease [Dehalococcoidia bacterium]|nr:serine protease [Dehalococcoidia bacterium]